jgi:hypothetical protein
MRLQPVLLEQGDHIQQLLEYYMGKNTPQRQEFIIDNLRVELDLIENEFIHFITCSEFHKNRKRYFDIQVANATRICYTIYRRKV